MDLRAPIDLPEGIDFTHPSTFEDGIPHDLFAELRRSAPVWWNPQRRGAAGYQDDGFWVVSTHDLVQEVSRSDGVFSSWENTALVRNEDDCPRAQVEAGRLTLLNKDGPEHATLRRIITRGFTPRAIKSLRDALRVRAEDIARTAATLGRGNFVEQAACELPLQAIADLLGIPQEDRRKIFDWSNTMTSRDDPDVVDDPLVAVREVMEYAHAMATDRRARPADDIVTKLVQAQIADGSLTPEEFAHFVILLIVAGSETTRNSITQGVMAFVDNPEQWELYKRERPTTAVDEIIRWASPVLSFQRTATCDTELGGQHIRKGDRVVMLYASANYDEQVFDDPRRFDITRSLNPHLSFGGTGVHYCVGANLARLEVDLMFNAIADHLPDISVLGPPVRMHSGWLNSIKALPVDYGSCPVAH
ncbi:cytochrome P450 [Rhodococcus sp. W8901]|uniref:cytochrome P450 n=1 Tax=Rhodococcus sp. W8901 TaxID=2742603 RepID=UPI0015835CB4|nr:cytochrome P450 [Rhodococcus sp. W8901]QKT10260.1 cytochrome P450 [Rhodococcus sp. W8901]